MRDCFIAQLSQMADADPDIVLITGDLGFGVLNEYSEKYPAQFINSGVAEQNMTAIATGMALEGFKTFTYSIANFPSLRCLEQIRNDSCYHDANVNIVSVGAGFAYGPLGISHHATEDMAIMRSLPGMTVFSPSGLWETSEITKKITGASGTCYLRLDKSVGDDAPRVADEKFVIGKMRVLREGKDLAVFVCGGILEEVLEVAEQLSRDGLETQIITVPTIKPFDKKTVEKVCENIPYVFSVEEHTLQGGLGSCIAEAIVDSGVYPKRFERIGIQDVFTSIVGSQKYLRNYYGLDAAGIKSRIVDIIN